MIAEPSELSKARTMRRRLSWGVRSGKPMRPKAVRAKAERAEAGAEAEADWAEVMNKLRRSGPRRGRS